MLLFLMAFSLHLAAFIVPSMTPTADQEQAWLKKEAASFRARTAGAEVAAATVALPGGAAEAGLLSHSENSFLAAAASTAGVLL